MTHFLWVEDFKAYNVNEENIISSTVRSVFGSVLDDKELRERLKEEDKNDAKEFLEEKGILLKLNLLEALEFIHDPNQLSQIDFVVLDVDMPLKRKDQRDDKQFLPPLIEQYGSEEELQKKAGYQIYTDLVIELGFPKSHILFCSNHAPYFKELTNKFTSANIKLPVSSNPDKAFLKKYDDTADIDKWIKNASRDYFVLRRGIIEACDLLESTTDDEELKEYFFGLKRYLPLQEPTNATEKQSIYLHLARAIVHDWDKNGHKIQDRRNDPIGCNLGWLLRTTRNWLAHDSLLKISDEKIISFIFLINARLLVKLSHELEKYEEILLSFFPKPKEALLENDILLNIKSFYKEAIEVSETNGVPFIGRYYSEITNNPSSPYLDYQVKFSKHENLPYYLSKFMQSFYPLSTR